MTALCWFLYVTAVVGWLVAVRQAHLKRRAEINRDYHRDCHRIWKRAAAEHFQTICDINREYVIVRKSSPEAMRWN